MDISNGQAKEQPTQEFSKNSTKMDWQKIQTKWQSKWQEAKLGQANVDKNKAKFFMIFAYPGISGFLHVGHMRGFSYADSICRLERMKGKEVLFPVGTHASGNHAFAFAKKLRDKDEKWINYLLKNGCTKEKLKDLEDPYKIIEYFNEVYVNEYWKKFGFLSDWDRFTSSTNKDYNKFIQWQFKKLKAKNMLIQKPYFATACVNCGPVAVDPSETDISKGGNAQKNEYTLLKFKLQSNQGLESTYLVAATLRPETIYGQTNLWINPTANYVQVELFVDDKKEHWLLSKEAAEKLQAQKDNVKIIADIDPNSLIGKSAIAPGIKREIPIFPATFVDPNVASGFVTCVPSHAPFDWMALKDLQSNQNLITKYALDPKTVSSILAISIIKTSNLEEHPAKQLCEREQISSSEDKQKLDLVTKELYKAEFHSGIMKENCGPYANLKTATAKNKMKEDLLDSNQADVFYDLTEEVICRCGSKVIVKRIDDQWFIDYSNQKVTDDSKQHVKNMRFFPKEYQENIPAILDWFGPRACARLGSWMGTKLPFDSKWTVEPISDSTIYPLFYIISKYTNSKQLTAADLTEEFFDYIFLGIELSKETKQKLSQEKIGSPAETNTADETIDETTDETTDETIDETKTAENTAETLTKLELLESIKQEANYFLPLDINLGGKEHKTVHFPVYLMNHLAILKPEFWPKGIFVNWWVTGKGSNKISKSKGGADPIPEAIEKFGVDAMRFYYAHIGSPHTDVAWDQDLVTGYKNQLEKIPFLFSELIEKASNNSTEKSLLDQWLESEFNVALKTINFSLLTYNLRDLATHTYYSIYDLFKWYSRRGGDNKSLVTQLLLTWSKLLCPITPHLAEELASKYELIPSDTFVSSSAWPKANLEKISAAASSTENYVKDTISSMRNVLKFANLSNGPQKYTLFVAKNWLYDFFKLVKQQLTSTRNVGEIIRAALAKEDFKQYGKEIAKMLPSLVKDTSKIPENIASNEIEFDALMSASYFLQQEFNCTIEIIDANKSDHPKSKAAMPSRAGILVE